MRARSSYQRPHLKTTKSKVLSLLDYCQISRVSMVMACAISTPWQSKLDLGGWFPKVPKELNKQIELEMKLKSRVSCGSGFVGQTL